MAIPEFLTEKLEAQYGNEIKDQIIDGYSKQRKVTFRVNTIKSSKEKVEEILKSQNIEFEKVSWSEDAFIIKKALIDLVKVTVK